MAFPQERMNRRVVCLSTKVVPQGDFHALSFEQEDRAVLLQGGVIHGRLQPGVFTPDALKDYRDTFAALKAALPEDVLDARVYTNVVDRPQNMTVMIEMLLASPASLPRYLQHPLHQGIGQRYNPNVEAIASFDCEVNEL